MSENFVIDLLAHYSVIDVLALNTYPLKREVGALHEAMVECGAVSGIIVSKSEEERIVVDGGVITVIPAWRFLFDLPDSCDQ